MPTPTDPVPSGFPSPASDFAEDRIELETYLMPQREASFLMRVAGSSMAGLGIHTGDLLVVDRSLPVTPGCVVVAVVDGAFTVQPWRRPIRDDGPPVTVWGVVRWSLHRVWPCVTSP